MIKAAEVKRKRPGKAPALPDDKLTAIELARRNRRRQQNRDHRQKIRLNTSTCISSLEAKEHELQKEHESLAAENEQIRNEILLLTEQIDKFEMLDDEMIKTQGDGKKRPGKAPALPDEKLSDIELERRNKRRKRNREQAQRIRNNRSEIINTLEAQADALTEEQQILNEENDGLRRKIRLLSERVEIFKKNDDLISESGSSEADVKMEPYDIARDDIARDDIARDNVARDNIVQNIVRNEIAQIVQNNIVRHDSARNDIVRMTHDIARVKQCVGELRDMRNSRDKEEPVFRTGNPIYPPAHAPLNAVTRVVIKNEFVDDEYNETDLHSNSRLTHYFVYEERSCV